MAEQTKTAEAKSVPKKRASSKQTTDDKQTDELVECPVCAYQFKPGDPRL